MSTTSTLAVVLTISDSELEEQLRACLLDAPVRVDIRSADGSLVEADLLLIDADPPGGSLEDLLGRWRARYPEAMVGVVHHSPEPQLILAAMRAKADEFIFLPIEAKLNGLIERVLERKGQARRQAGKVIGFISAKGGCGATSVGCHVAAALAERAQDRVLLADLDLETGLVAFVMKTEARYSILDALKNLHRLDESYWKKIVAIRKRLDILPAPASLSASDALTPEALRQVFRFLRPAYSWSVIDLGRGLNAMTLAVLEELDEIHLVSTTAVAALFRAKQCVQQLMEIGFPLDRIRLILNQVGRQKQLTSGELKKMIGVPVFAELPAHGEMEEAYSDGRLVSANSELGRRFGELAANIAGLPKLEKNSDNGDAGGLSGLGDLWRRAIPRFSGPA